MALKRLFTARMKQGMFDPPSMVPYSKIDEKLLDGAAHRAMARKLANESMVLLKNDGVLPLKTSGVKMRWWGRWRTDESAAGKLQRNSDAFGLGAGRNEGGISRRDDSFCAGTQFLSKEAAVVPGALLSADGKPGVKASYYSMKDMLSFMLAATTQTPLASRTEAGIGVSSSGAARRSGEHERLHCYLGRNADSGGER